MQKCEGGVCFSNVMLIPIRKFSLLEDARGQLADRHLEKSAVWII